jgi:hypothetical protein
MQKDPVINEPDGRGRGDNVNPGINTGQVVALGTNVAVGVGILTFAGYYVDRRQGEGYIWTMCGLGAGLLYGAYEIWKVIRMLNLENNRSSDMPEKGPGVK